MNRLLFYGGNEATGWMDSENVGFHRREWFRIGVNENV